MASTKVLLKTSKILKNGEHPIVIRVIKDRKTKFIFTGQSCHPDLWDSKNNKPKSKHPNKQMLELFISKKSIEAQNIILELENNNEVYSSDSFKKIFKSKSKKTTVFEFWQQIIDNLISTDNIGNANVYKDCLRSLKKYRNDSNLFFSDIDVSFLKKYEQDFIKRKVSYNTISVHMRTIRSVFNKAEEEKLIKKGIYPFNEYKISKLNTTTEKRALTKNQIDKIKDLKLEDGSKISDSKNYFMFSYYLRGMNFTDLALLKWENIDSNRLKYIRAKTGKHHNIGLLEPANKILEYYKQFMKSKSSYVFPILNNNHISAIQIDNRISKMNKAVNKDLKEIALMTKIDFNLTTYVARHSYATIMKKGGVSTSIISESLGHGNEKTTQIYLDSFENNVLDEASKTIL
jgi:site-specific recombinase XerD